MSASEINKPDKPQQSPLASEQPSAESLEMLGLNNKRDNPWFTQALHLADVWEGLDFK